jgi:hypothetical protein
MATTITGNGPLKTTRVDLGATAAKVEAITLPRWTREVEVSVYAADNTTAAAGTISSSGTDGGDPDASAIRIDSGERKFFGFAPSDNEVTIYVSGDVVNAAAHLRVTT